MNARSSRRHWMGTAVLAVLCITPAAAAQDRFESAERAYSDGRIDDAIAGYTAILEAEGNGPRELHRVHLRLGLFHAVAGDGARARSHFRVALAIDAATEPPSELNPELRRAFVEARPAQLRLALAARDPSREAGSVVDLGFDESLRDLVARFRVRALAGDVETWTDTVGGAATAVEIPASAWRDGDLSVSVDALDAHGGVLVSGSLRVAVEVRATRDDVPIEALREGEDQELDDGGSAWPWVLLGGGIALAAGVALALVIALSDTEYVVGPPEVR